MKSKGIEYKKNPTQWWEDEAIHTWFKGEKAKLSAAARQKFERKYRKAA